MHSQPHLDDLHCEFEQAQQEVLTFALSEQMPPSPRRQTHKRATHKSTEKHRLGLIAQCPQNPSTALNLKQLNKQIKRIQCLNGRCITLGSAIFRSTFECGSLHDVLQTAPQTYTVTLPTQTNSLRSSAWFYFSVEGVKGEVNFVVTGFTKSTSLYNENMKVCYRESQEMTWRRGCSKIAYVEREGEEGESLGYQLRFTFFFKHQQATPVEFAYCFPYGIKRLYQLLSPVGGQVSQLGLSSQGLSIPMLTLGHLGSPQVLVFSARVHPGETVSSFVMEGLIKELLSDNQHSTLLKQHYYILIIPMLNPDGVVRGNYRFSATGCDLNRKWKQPKLIQHPQIYHLRELIRNIRKDKQIAMFIDLHGHSRKKNAFFYGCCEAGSNNHKPREFPLLMEKLHDAFKYSNCCFAMQKDKEGTARISLWNELKLDYIYTLETSFCGSEDGGNYLENDYIKIGRKLCQGIAIHLYEQLPKSSSGSIPLRSLQKMSLLKVKAREELESNPSLLAVGQQDDSGSESEPEAGEIPESQRNPETGLPRREEFLKESADPRIRKHKVNKILSQQSVRDTHRSNKLKSEMLTEEQLPKGTHPGASQKKVNRTLLIDPDPVPFDRLQIKVANSVNTFEMQTLRASALYQRNLRVHSITKNSREYSEHSKRLVNPFTETTEIKEERMKVHLIHGREGAQYRRVRKIAQQNLKRQMLTPESSKMVKELQTNQLEMNSNWSNASRFQANSQKNRRASLQTYIRRAPKLQEFKKLSINGDELNVRCFGRHIYI